ncbi:sodium-dependent transporter [Pseudohaliea sp.]|uniref:sodium-dependent transporter n=1 Tax=Pseudohaliea sp. TaxID=2740289 RepID=UPI0032EC288B
MVGPISTHEHAHWSSRMSFLMASVGFAVGLGNIWRFPYVTGENGGAAFVLVYLCCAFGVGVPIVIAEIMIGRRGQAGTAGSMKVVAAQEGRSPLWIGVGYVNQLAAFLIQAVYAVIVGWVLWYLFKAVTTGFVGVDATFADAEFARVTSDTIGMLLWTVVGILICGGVLYAGVKDGIERAVNVLMPTLFGLLLLLVGFNVFAGGFEEALVWLFKADFSKINAQVFLAALGQAFFSVGVGMAAMMAYGSYLPKETRIASSAIIIVIADTLVAILAGLVIFPAVFNNGLDPAAGPGLIFQTLPVAFAQMPGGYFFACLFFLLLSVAGITSMVALLEALVSWLEELHGFPRHRATVVIIGANILFSLLSVLGYTVLADWQLFGLPINTAADYVSNQILLPLGGLLIAIFAGWFVTRKSSRDELALNSNFAFELWRFLIRWPVPAAVLVIFVMGVSD